VRFGRGFDPKDQPPFAPPFSTPERARGGDLDAIAKAGSTARQDLEETWSSFSDDLQSAAKRAELEAEKAQLEKKVAELREQIADMERAAEADSGAIVTTGSDLDDLKAALAEAEQDLANVTHELNVHNQEHPP
jgi:chromosome segregation ATPase